MTMTPPDKPSSELAACTCAAHDDTSPFLDPHAEDCARKIAFREKLATTFTMTDQRSTCGLHRLPFRERWPVGMGIFAVEASRIVLGMPSVHAEARELAGLPADAKIEPKMVEAVLDRRPACCRVTREQLVELYVASKIGLVKHCHYCGAYAKGTPIETEQQGRIDHVCFNCMSTASSTPQEVQ